jgi:hypothetical protein
VTLGPLMHEFGWAADDFDRLAGGSLAGHIVECGCQATGGLFTDWAEVPDWPNIGYPIVACRSDGTFELTKPAGTGGLVRRAAVAEQLLYEIGDPAIVGIDAVAKAERTGQAILARTRTSPAISAASSSSRPATTACG